MLLNIASSYAFVPGLNDRGKFPQIREGKDDAPERKGYIDLLLSWRSTTLTLATVALDLTHA